MVVTLKDLEGKIIAYCEYKIVGPSGYEIDNGEYIWVNDLWIYEDYRGKNTFNRIIDEILRKVPQAKYGYFKRGKYGGRMKIFKRSQWERRRNAYDDVILGR
jgi:hypothetical protein